MGGGSLAGDEVVSVEEDARGAGEGGGFWQRQVCQGGGCERSGGGGAFGVLREVGGLGGCVVAEGG